MKPVLYAYNFRGLTRMMLSIYYLLLDKMPHQNKIATMLTALDMIYRASNENIEYYARETGECVLALTPEQFSARIDLEMKDPEVTAYVDDYQLMKSLIFLFTYHSSEVTALFSEIMQFIQLLAWSENMHKLHSQVTTEDSEQYFWGLDGEDFSVMYEIE